MLVQLVAADPDGLDRTCSGCRPDRCFNHVGQIVAKMRRMPTVVITRRDWWKVVDACRETFNQPAYDELSAVLHYGICPRSIITPTSRELFGLCRITGGIQAKTPGEFYNLPSKWVHAVAIIADTLAQCRGLSHAG